MRNHIKKTHFDLWEKEYNGKRFSAVKLSEMNAEKRSNSENTFDKDKADLNKYWPCQTCSKIFPSLPTLTKHAEIHNKVEGMLQMLQKSFGVGPLKSNQSSSQKTKVTTPPVMKKVVIKSEPSMPQGLNCHQCDKTFENISILTNHAEIHKKAERKTHDKMNHAKQLSKTTSSQIIKKEPGAGNNCFQCSQCDKTFANPTYLKIHITMKHKNKDSSGQINSDPQDKIKREPEVSANNCFQCSKCDRNFASPVHLKIHVTKKHSTASQKKSSVELNSENSMMQTTVVPNVTFQQIKSDPKDKPFNCSLCDKTFADPKFLKIHFTVKHSTASHKDSSEVSNSDPLEKCFHCSLCENSYTDPSNLRRHIRKKHSLESRTIPQQDKSTKPQDKPYQCSLCDKSFEDPSQLKRHDTMKHTSGNNGQIPIQVLPDQVQAELLKFASKKDKAFSCSQCNNSFANQSHLKRHVNMKHNEPEVPSFNHGILGDIIPMDILGA